MLSRYRKVMSILIAIAAILLAGYALIPKPPLLDNLTFSQAVYSDQQQLLYLSLTNDEKYRLYVPLKAISPLLVQATLLQEDKHFFAHPGFNPWALARALWKTYIVGGRRVGGSTITMQVARLRHHIHSRKISGKLLQLMRAIQLERHYSKRQILEAYLNLAPYGGNIEGVGAASLIYFNKPVGQLTLPEALTLAVIPQNPLRRKPQPKRLTELKQARDQLFRQWLLQHPHDSSKQALMNLPLKLNRQIKIVRVAPHFVYQVLQLNKTASHIETTLNVKLQQMLEKVTKRYLSRKYNLGVENLAVMLVDSRTMAVKALIGSADFFNANIDGQVNGTLAKRSPGSALKPFIYALAMDQGLIHPFTMLKDAPRSFGAYNPENFDNEFMGPVKAVDALVLSRNIPAIYLADQLHNPSLYEFLQQAQIKNLKSAPHYGLALALGGAEVTMEELVQLYALLPNLGWWKPLRYLETQPYVRGKRLLSPEAAFLTLDMLQANFRPAFFQPKLPVAWKTGTSSAFRDAWSVGIFGQYILAVWVGNFKGNGNPAFVGKSIAAPLMFELIDAIAAHKQLIKPLALNPYHLNLIKTPVCAASGMLPTRFCQHTVSSWFIPGKSPIKTDTIFREVMIDGRTGERTCAVDEHTQFKVYEFWPTDLLKIYRLAGIQRLTPPPYKKSCISLHQDADGIAPRITSPQQEFVYTFRVNQPAANKILFSATADTDVKTLYWFVNQQYVGKTQPEEAFSWQAVPGKFIIRAVDDHGRADARDIHVQVF